MRAPLAKDSSKRSSLVSGSVWHWRRDPNPHAFTYPMLLVQIDVDELESGTLSNSIFGYNKWRICSIWSADYLTGSSPIRGKVESFLQAQGATGSPARITLVTMPRYFGYVFNPVSFFICFDKDSRVTACITQVNNTFGESHVYPLVCEPSAVPVSWTFGKGFFVSPFFDSRGEYTLEVRSEGETLSIRVDLHREAQHVFAATLQGKAKPLSKVSLFRALLTYPVTLLLTMPRIHMQALILFFRVGATPEPKPSASGPYTIRSKQNIIHRARLALLSLLRKSRKV